MPFTFSHPAVAVPLVRRIKKLSVTGLVIGSMIPDVEYFMRMKSLSRYSHSWAGVLWFDLPLGLLTAALFHGFLRNAVIVQLPLFVQQKVWTLLKFDWFGWLRRHWPMIILSFVIGSVSHLLWDRFVHAGARFLNGLSEVYTTLDEDDDFLIYYLFFGINSLIGLAVLWRYFRALPSHPVIPVAGQKQISTAFWTACAAFSIVIFLVRIMTAERLPFLSWIDTAIAAFFLSLVLTVLIQKSFSGKETKAAVKRAS